VTEKAPGTLGTRMTGGGFGGSTVSLVRRVDVAAFRRFVSDRYAAATGRVPDIHVMDAGDRGARVL
jgi:galactokinase